MKNILEFKKTFQETLKARLKKKKDWVIELAELLHCSTDAIYKKNRPDSFYSVEELVILSNHYSISLDELIIEQKDIVRFSAPNVSKPIKSINDYLSRLKDTFQNLDYFHDVHIYYATRELPIFYYFINEDLALFKLYVFARNIWKISPYSTQKYLKDNFPSGLYPSLQLLWKKYVNLVTHEYWNTNVLDSTIQQIQFYFESGELSAQDSIKILNGLEEVLFKVKEMAFKNRKNDLDNNFFLYENKILHTSNHILVKSKERDIVYLTFDNPNFIITDDQSFINYTENWYKTIHENSYIIGQGSGHVALTFFNNLNIRIDQLKKRVLNE